MRQRVIKSGNSLVVVIPMEFVKSVGIKRGDGVTVETCPEEAKIFYKFTGWQQLPLSDTLLKKGKKDK